MFFLFTGTHLAAGHWQGFYLALSSDSLAFAFRFIEVRLHGPGLEVDAVFLEFIATSLVEDDTTCGIPFAHESPIT